MTSIYRLPIEEITFFLLPLERLNLALTCRTLYRRTEGSLNLQFDHLIMYTQHRMKLLKNLFKNRKHRPQVHSFNGRSYHTISKPLYSLPRELLNVNYVKITEKPGQVVLENEQSDLLLVHSALFSEPECLDTGTSFEILATAEDLNKNIDFTNQAILLRRQENLLSKLKRNGEQAKQRLQDEAFESIRKPGVFVIILCHGGHFCIAAFSEQGKCIAHDSDHRYVTRKKQGGRQLTKDKASGGIHSAGASIRRENEKHHQDAIQLSLQANRGLLQSSSLVFLYAPGINKSFFFGEFGALEEYRSKVRSTGMSAGKAKFTEAEKVFHELTSAQFLFNLRG